MDVVAGPILSFILAAIDIYVVFLIAAVILSWLYAFNVINTSNQFLYMVADFLRRVTEPALAPIRRFLPDLGGVDISPIILILVLEYLVKGLLINIFRGL
jgi:YggT family protein